MGPTSKISNVQSGFTLVEMMVALTIGVFILGGLTAVVISSGSSARANDRTSELQTNGRYALDVIRRDVQHAGQSGMMPNVSMIAAKTSGYFTNAPGVAVTSDCAAGFAIKLEQPVMGADDSNPYTGSCISTANYYQGDILVVRYADMQNSLTVAPATATAEPSFGVASDIYLRSSYAVSTLFQKGGKAPYILGSGPMQDQLLKTYVYYISSYTETVGDGVPALWRVALKAGAMTPELVASGIENMQVQYGVVDANLNTQYSNADTVSAANQWPLVKSVRVWLLVRNSSSEKGEGYSNQTTYQMGDVSYTPTSGVNDQFRRQLFTTTIEMRN